jgi:hypothetical protein
VNCRFRNVLETTNEDGEEIIQIPTSIGQQTVNLEFPSQRTNNKLEKLASEFGNGDLLNIKHETAQIAFKPLLENQTTSIFSTEL